MVTTADILNAKVLLVDDEVITVRLLEHVLRNAGYTAIQATTNPREVCALHRQHRYDLILLDMEMPGLNGFQVMEGLKKIETDSYLPVLVITSQPDYMLRALRSGAKDFISKPFDLAEVLTRVHNMLEVRLLHQETKRLYAQVTAEQKLSERLLLNVLPQSIAQRLKARPDVIADSFPEVTVLFADIVGFTKLSANVTPEDLVAMLNEVFTAFDNIADHHGLEKIKTIGDAYMAVAGLPVPSANHAEQAAHMALDMLAVMNRFNEQRADQLQLRIGLNTGPVVAGVIGKRKFTYDLWGATVNTASRMESSGMDGRIQVTATTQQRLCELFLLEKRGTAATETKDQIETWFLTGRRNGAASHAPSVPARE